MERILWVAFTAEARKRQLESTPDFITTFRKGPKWLRADLVGQRVELVNCQKAHWTPCTEDCEVFASGYVYSVKSCAFRDIDPIDHMRQSSDMTPEARLDIMRRVYGEYEPETLTTVITITDLVVRP